MDFNYSPEEEAFRKEVRDWLAENMKELPEWWGRRDVTGPEPDSEEYNQFSLWWHRKLYDAGYVGIAWPKEYGGRGATLIEQVVFSEEMAKAGTPGSANIMGLAWVGPVIISYGTEEQKKRFLPKILTAEEIWCTLYSEPEAGSDLANVQTRAVEDGDDFVINGQKVWSSAAQQSDWGVLLARTDPDAPKHRGLSYLLVNMHSPGITLRPLRQITEITGGAGYSAFCETFFDDVRIPKHQILGEKNKGWYVLMGALEFERSFLGESIGRENTIKSLIGVAKGTEHNGQSLSKDPLIRQRLAQFYIEVNILKYLGLRNLTQQLRGGRPGSEGVIIPLFAAEFEQRLQDFAMQVQGPYCQLITGSKYAIDQGRWQQSFIHARMQTIGGGTSEVRRNIIAQRVLGLPRSY